LGWEENAEANKKYPSNSGKALGGKDKGKERVEEENRDSSERASSLKGYKEKG